MFAAIRNNQLTALKLLNWWEPKLFDRDMDDSILLAIKCGFWRIAVYTVYPYVQVKTIHPPAIGLAKYLGCLSEWYSKEMTIRTFLYERCDISKIKNWPWPKFRN